MDTSVVCMYDVHNNIIDYAYYAKYFVFLLRFQVQSIESIEQFENARGFLKNYPIVHVRQ